jgi:hypothetical protein
LRPARRRAALAVPAGREPVRISSSLRSVHCSGTYATAAQNLQFERRCLI